MNFAKTFNLFLTVLLIALAILYLLFRYFSALSLITVMSTMVVVGMLAGGMLFGFVGLFRSEDQNRNLLLVLCACIFAVGMVEVLAQLRQAWAVPKTAVRLPSESFDMRSLAEVIRDKRKAGELVYGYVNPVGFGIEGLTPISDARSFWCNESGAYDGFQTDKFGFRNPPGLLNDPEFRPRLVALGDSITAGCGVKDGELMVDLLRAEFEPATINAAVGGSGPLQQYGFFKEYMAVFKPELVLWFYFEGNDLGNLENELNESYLKFYLEREETRQLPQQQQRLREELVRWHEESLAETERPLRVASQKTVSSILPWENIAAFLMRSIILNRAHYLAKQVTRPRAKLISAYSDLLNRARDMVAKWGGQIIIVYVPEQARYSEWISLQPLSHRDAKQELLKMFQRMNFQVIDLEREFKKQVEDPSILYPAGLGADVHLNARGNRLAASIIIENLRERTLWK